MTRRPLYRVLITASAQRDLHRLPADVAARVRIPLRGLALDPRPPGARKVVDTGFWRVRVGDLRIVYVVDDGGRVVRVDRVVRRSESTYRRRR